jgi:hypothetical protein
VVVPEGDDVETVRARLERVPLAAGEVDDAVTLAHLVHPHLALSAELLPGPTGAAQHVEELLLGGLDVRRRRPHARIDLDSVDADPPRVGRRREVRPGSGEVPELGAVGFRFVPMGDHKLNPRRTREIPARRPETGKRRKGAS